MKNAFLWKWQSTDDGQVILGSLTLYNIGLDSRFGVELVQSVSLLLGQGHCLAASEETDPLTVHHCCGGQAAYNISSIYSLEMNKCRRRWGKLSSGTQLWFMRRIFLPMWNNFSSHFGSVLWGNKDVGDVPKEPPSHKLAAHKKHPTLFSVKRPLAYECFLLSWDGECHW